MNQYGVDVNYFKSKMYLILRDIQYITPDELHRKLSNLADVANKSKTQNIDDKKLNKESK